VTDAAAYNPPERIMVVRPTFEENTERDLRYTPDGTDFVIENGEEFFNRPLYGGNTAFRVDAGDKPEFSMYLPGHGGNLRFGIRTAQEAKWLNNADTIISRYQPGAMLYEIRDALLDDATLYLAVMGLYEGDGFIVQVRLKGTDEPVELIAAFGGAGGKRGKRSGDIGCESEPIRQFFQLKPENCKDNRFTIDENSFVLKGPRATLAGIFANQAVLTVADAHKWNDIGELLSTASGSPEYPVVTSVMSFSSETPLYVVVKHVGDDDAMDLTYVQLPELFEETQQQRRQIAHQVVVDTPDAYINAAVSALCIAADAIWDEKQGSVMHGAVAWRSKYLGWRGPYANDALGWHDRARRHFRYWAAQQDTSPVPEKILPADPTAHLARNEPSLHSNGALSHKHYDMNLVYMDALFRHILWTGDMDLLAELWPVIERHMAWERRLFRRPFGDDKLPLYEAYAAIWASDDLQYHGGGVTHASAYNYFHNCLVARFAKLLGKDPTPYEQEAELIQKAMNKYLWQDDYGWYAEFRDLLGLQNAHPSAALWTFYHTLDSQAADPLQAWQMSRFVDTQIAHIPVYGGDIPKGKYFTLPTTNWMPYTWSTNNVVMAEAAHTSLAYWQAQRPEKAFALFKGCILDSMYMGKCPGNAGMTTTFDMARGEAQRDFGDAVGMVSRALIEGLYGIVPDLPVGELNITPGFPGSWEYAKLEHPNLKYNYRRDGQSETYLIKPSFSKPLSFRLRIRACKTHVEAVTVNGEPANWTSVQEAVGGPAVQINCKSAPQYDVKVLWKGPEPAGVQSHPIAAKESAFQVNFDGATVIDVRDTQKALREVEIQSHTLSGKAAGIPGHRTVFAELEQGQMTWWQPVEFEIRKPFEVIAGPQEKEDSVQFRIQNNTAKTVDTKAILRAGTKQGEMLLEVPAYSLSSYISLSAKDYQLLPGSNRIFIDMGNGKTCEGIITNWHIKTDNLLQQCRPLDLSQRYNDQLTQIFKNEYLSPRSPYCSLAIPIQGIGSWCNFVKTFDVDDSGLRAAAKNNDGLFELPQGIPFKIPVEANIKNTVFTSQWDNYPGMVTIKLDGKARHLYVLMAGSTNSMQSQFDNGEVIVTYNDGGSERLVLRNPTTWWPIDQDYFIDDFGFKRPEPIPPRVNLKTGQVRVLDMTQYKGKGGTIDGGAATVLDIPLNVKKELQSIRLRTLANEVIIGLISATLVR
jgi:hypothetical protein